MHNLNYEVQVVGQELEAVALVTLDKKLSEPAHELGRLLPGVARAHLPRTTLLDGFLRLPVCREDASLILFGERGVPVQRRRTVAQSPWPTQSIAQLTDGQSRRLDHFFAE